MTGPVVPGAALDTGSAGSRPPLRVGLVGAGPWAAVFHAPMLAAGPHTRLVGIWSRRPQPAADLARQHGARAFDRYEDLLSACEAVAFAVAPDAQAELAPVAAAAGRHLLLEKPLALDLAGAEALAAAVEKAGVISQVVLTQRYTPVMREFLVRAADIRPEAARCASISGAALAGGMFATPWRLAEGALLDIGPHILDLLQAAVGPITEISADGEPVRVVLLTCRHRSGAVSQAALSITQAITEAVWTLELYGRDGAARFDSAAVDMAPQMAEAARAIPREWAEAVRSGAGHPLDAAHALGLQRLIDAATRSLAR